MNPLEILNADLAVARAAETAAHLAAAEADAYAAVASEATAHARDAIKDTP